MLPSGSNCPLALPVLWVSCWSVRHTVFFWCDRLIFLTSFPGLMPREAFSHSGSRQLDSCINININICMQRELHWLISRVSLATNLNNIFFSCVCAVLKVVFGWRSLCASVTERERQKKKKTEYGLVTFTMLFGAVLWCTNVYMWNILYLYTYRSILDGLLIILSLSNEPLWPIGATNQVSLFIICESFILTFLDFILHFRGGLITHQEFSNICLH